MSIASTFGAPMSFYGLNGPGELVDCPDCGQHADALFGDHGGQCLEAAAVVLPNSALGIIHRYALTHLHFSAEQIRTVLDDKGVKPSARGPAFGAAKRRGWIEHDGWEQSTGDTAKGASLKTYTSRIYQPAAHAARAGRRTA